MTFLFLLLHFSLALDPSIFNRDSTKLVNTDMIEAIHAVFDEIYFKHYRTVIIIDCVNDTQDNYFKDFKNSIQTNKNSNFVFRSAETSMIYKAFKNRVRNCLILVDTLESFMKLNDVIKTDLFSTRGRYLIAFFNGYIGIEKTKIISDTLWGRGFYNFAYFYEQNGLINITVCKFFSNSCNKTDEFQRSTYKNGQFGNVTETIFSKLRFKDLFGCPIKIVSFGRCPATCFNKTEDGNELFGYDAEVIQELSKRLNFKQKIRILSGEQRWGTVLENGTVTDALKRLTDGRSQIAYGGYFLSSFKKLELLDSSEPYFAVPIMLVIPPGKKFTAIEKLLQPFDEPVWILLLITFTFGIFTIFVINHKLKHLKEIVYGRNVKSPCMNMLAAVVGLQQNILPSRNFSRFILMSFLIFCLVMRNAYQGSLYNFLQSDGRHKEVQSIDEMIKKDFVFYIYETYVDFIDNSTEMYKRRVVIRREADLPYKQTVDASLKGAYINPLTNIVYRNKKRVGNYSMKACAEKVSVLHIVMYFVKDFFLKSAIDEKLREFRAAGLIQHWTDKHIDKRFVTMKDKVTGPRKLTLEHLSGIFDIFVIGNLLGIFIFIVELIYFKIQQIRIKRRRKKAFKCIKLAKLRRKFS